MPRVQPPSPARPSILAWTGHRSIDSPEPLREAINRVLTNLRPHLGRGSAALGADLLVAEAFRDHNIPYTILLPYPRPNFEPDATPQDARRIDTVLRHASTVSTLVAATTPYAELVDALLTDADTLLAIWDGNPARGPGGTAEVVDRALARGIAVIRVDSQTGKTTASPR